MAQTIDGPDAVAARANELYWSGGMTVDDIVEELGISRTALYSAIEPAPAGLTCADCRVRMVHTNRTMRERGMDRCHEVRIAERFCQKVDRTALDGAHGGGNVAVPRDEDDGRMFAVCDLLLEIEAVDVRQFDVKDKSGRQIRLVRPHIFSGRPVADRTYSV